ncbi:hypothetical protein PENSPDRAFT_672705 [Peniophora sp. CONT]|nr:hypothetical protein PENSPDRAFT_672705 [Peniophora sp. CONT]
MSGIERPRGQEDRIPLLLRKLERENSTLRKELNDVSLEASVTQEKYANIVAAHKRFIEEMKCLKAAHEVNSHVSVLVYALSEAYDAKTDHIQQLKTSIRAMETYIKRLSAEIEYLQPLRSLPGELNEIRVDLEEKDTELERYRGHCSELEEIIVNLRDEIEELRGKDMEAGTGTYGGIEVIETHTGSALEDADLSPDTQSMTRDLVLVVNAPLMS